MAQLNGAQKVFIVTRLACFDTPGMVAEAFLATYKVRITPQQASYYDPTNSMGNKIAPKLVDLFHETREAFKKSTMDMPIAQKSYRLKGIAAIYEKCAARGNTQGALKALEQAARELGGSYTNVQAHTGKVEHTVTDVSDQELVDRLAKLGIVVPMPGMPGAMSVMPDIPQDPQPEVRH